MITYTRHPPHGYRVQTMGENNRDDESGSLRVHVGEMPRRLQAASGDVIWTQRVDRSFRPPCSLLPFIHSVHVRPRRPSASHLDMLPGTVLFGAISSNWAGLANQKPGSSSVLVLFRGIWKAYIPVGYATR